MAGRPKWGDILPEIVVAGVTSIRMSWIEPDTRGSAITGYIVEREASDNPGRWHTLYDGTNEPYVRFIVISDLEVGVSYRFNVYALNGIGRSVPPTTITYSVARPYTSDTFFPLRYDPSVVHGRDTSVAPYKAGVPERFIVEAKHPVTTENEYGVGGRIYILSIHDRCTMDATNTLCIPVLEDETGYQDHRHLLEAPPECCNLAFDPGVGYYTFSNVIFRKTANYSVVIESLFQGGLLGQYWENSYYLGLPMMVRLDPLLHFDWNTSAITELASDLVSVRWTGFIKGPQAGDVIGGVTAGAQDEYFLYFDVDDTVKVWISGHVVIDH
jgi:hypothetical protein